MLTKDCSHAHYHMHLNASIPPENCQHFLNLSKTLRLNTEISMNIDKELVLKLHDGKKKNY